MGSIMRIIEPKHFEALPRIKHKRHYRRYIVLLLIMGIIIGLGWVGYHRYNQPLPAYTITPGKELSTGPEVKFAWPTYGQSAVGIVGKGVIDSNNSDEPQPTASVAKIITALVVQDKEPLALNQDGDDIPITKADQQIYDKYYLVNGSIVPVLPGTTLTQKQLMQAMLIPSANNMAETLTNYTFGSQEEYVSYANNYLKENGFVKTTVADSSGFSPDTVSTAAELVRIGELAMNDPVIAQIVGQSQAVIPNGGTVTSTNWLLNKDGVNGIKTGNTNQAGGCYLVSAVVTHPDNTKSTVIAVIMGAKTVDQAITDIQPLVFVQAKSGFNDVAVLSEGQQLGVIATAWGEKAAITSASDLSLFGWQEDRPQYTLDVTDVTQVERTVDGQVIGSAKVTLGQSSDTVAVKQTGTINPPDFWWKFKRIFNS